MTAAAEIFFESQTYRDRAFLMAEEGWKFNATVIDGARKSDFRVRHGAVRSVPAASESGLLFLRVRKFLKWTVTIRFHPSHWHDLKPCQTS